MCSVIVLLTIATVGVSGCTTVGVSREASEAGDRTWITHNYDTQSDDFRLNYVPPSRASAKKHTVFPYHAEYPRHVGFSRGATYFPRPQTQSNNMNMPLTSPFFEIDFANDPELQDGLEVQLFTFKLLLSQLNFEISYDICVVFP
jgi:hypothetical protein